MDSELILVAALFLQYKEFPFLEQTHFSPNFCSLRSSQTPWVIDLYSMSTLDLVTRLYFFTSPSN